MNLAALLKNQFVGFKTFFKSVQTKSGTVSQLYFPIVRVPRRLRVRTRGRAKFGHTVAFGSKVHLATECAGPGTAGAPPTAGPDCR